MHQIGVLREHPLSHYFVSQEPLCIIKLFVKFAHRFIFFKRDFTPQGFRTYLISVRPHVLSKLLYIHSYGIAPGTPLGGCNPPHPASIATPTPMLRTKRPKSKLFT